MPNDSSESNKLNNKNEFPNQGNFSASNNKMPDSLKNNIEQKRIQNMANLALGPTGGKLAKTAMNSNLVKNKLNKSKNLFPGAGMLFGSSTNSSESDEDLEELEGEENTSPQSDILRKVSIIGGGLGFIGCFGFIIIICIIVSIFILPIMWIQDKIDAVTNFVEDTRVSLMNWITRGTYCSNETECQQIEQNNFYDKVLSVHENYKEKYDVELNSELIIATLTYYDTTLTGDESFTTDSEGNEIPNPSSMVDFKKGEKKVKELAGNMVSVGRRCLGDNGNIVAEYVGDNNTKCSTGTTEEKYYYLDEDGYKKYLEDTFIRKYYYNGETTDYVNEQIPRVISEIYSRAEIANYLNGNENTSDNFISNNATVIITSCTGAALEEVTLYEYLQGVLYYEGYATNRSEEFLKAMAIASKNYLYAINGATEDNIPTTLRVKNCRQNQIYCNVENGCHNMNDSTDENYQTIASGPDSNNNYHRAPVTDVETLEKIKRAIDSTYDEFIISNGTFVYTQYRSECSSKGLICDSTTNIMDQTIANNMVNSGSTYHDVIDAFYQGNIQQITLAIAGYPLDLEHNYITSPFGMRVYPFGCACKSHGGTDISAPTDANIYSIADGVVTVVGNLPSKINGYGYYMEIGHGAYIDGRYEYYSLYAHQVRMPSLKVGDTVKAGQKIGSVGSTGASTGPHLHIEIYSYVNGNKSRKDPVTYFDNIELEGQKGGALFESEAKCNASLEKAQCLERSS